MVSQEVKRETMRECLSCPLCNSILLDATTISECLHSFCRKCIYEKITEDEIECCPVCNIDLGGTPLDKLRPDHNLQGLTAKIFPQTPGPARRKERLMSSLVVTTHKALARAGTTTRRRTKTTTRKELPDSGSLANETVVLKNTISPDTQEKKQSYTESFSNKENNDGDEPWDPKPLNFLVQVANMTKPLKSSASLGSGLNSKQADASHKQFQGEQNKVKDQKSKFKSESQKINNGGDHTTSETANPKRRPMRTQRKRPATTFGDGSSAERERRNGPVWFSLVASTDQEGKTSLPQIAANFLRIRDGNIPVSFIQKYLMRKLDIQSETEMYGRSGDSNA